MKAWAAFWLGLVALIIVGWSWPARFDCAVLHVQGACDHIAAIYAPAKPT